MSAIFDFPSLIAVILLLICSSTYVRALTLKRDPATGAETSILDNNKHGILSIAWKFARIGERLSPYVAVACVLMVVHILFIR